MRVKRVVKKAPWRASGLCQLPGTHPRTSDGLVRPSLRCWWAQRLWVLYFSTHSLRWVLIRDPREEFETQALLCTDLDADPERIICWFVRRWQMETTFQEVRQRLGFETHRQCSELAIRRTAPALLGLFSLVTLFAHQQMAKGADSARQTAW